jgi:hypothetical protein
MLPTTDEGHRGMLPCVPIAVQAFGKHHGNPMFNAYDGYPYGVRDAALAKS